LPHLRDFELLGLLLHLLKEDGEVLRDLIVANEVLDVVTSVELLTEVLTHLIDLRNGIWELDVWLVGVVETDWTKDLELFLDSLGVILSLILIDLDGISILSVSEPLKIWDLLLEATEMESVVPDTTDSHHESDSDLDAYWLLLRANVGSVDGQTIINCLFTEIFKLIN